MLGPDWQHATLLYVSFACIVLALRTGVLVTVLRTSAPTRISRVVLFGLPALMALALLPMYPPTAVDMFHYQAMGRIFWIYGANPLTTPQGDFPYPIGISWADLASPYGPLWSFIVAPAALLPGEHFVVGLLAYKALSVLSLAGCTSLIWRLVRRTLPGTEVFAVVLFAWNPFVLMRVVGNGHNDLWMMLFVLAALERMERTRWTQAIALLALGVLLKFVPALLAPPFLLYIWTHAEGSRLRRLGQIALAGLVSLALAVLCYAPFWVGPETFDNVRKESAHMITSTPVLLTLVTTRWFEEPLATDLASLIPKLLFAACYLAFVWEARRDFNRLVGMSFAICFIYLVLAASWFRPWYMLWPIAIGALRPRTWLGATVVAISIACAFPDLVEQFRSDWPLIAEYGRAIAAPILLGFLPPLLVWLIGVGLTDSFSLVRRKVEPRLD
ncbi:MAG: DUF2029 domain-containing protein [Chloroflexi bacterium]|nr:MAG: DUF2029 domain-containing protein [Chloroflexota bacterium]